MSGTDYAASTCYQQAGMWFFAWLWFGVLLAFEPLCIGVQG